jgi:tetratricopeptide (TPR) repeat protein
MYTLVGLLLLVGCNSGKKEDDSKIMTPSKEKELTDIVAKYPDSLILRENLIQYYRENGNYDQAIAETDKAIRRDSVNPRLFDIKAMLYFEDGDTLASIRAFETAVRLYPDPVYFISLGTLYAQTRNPLALQVADDLLKQKPLKTEKEALFIKGLYYSSINEKQKALVFFDKALSVDFNFMEAYREKALALSDLGQYAEALAVLDKAVVVRNDFVEGYYFRGKILEKLNRKEEAVESYQRALLFDAGYIEARDALARLGVK